MKKAVLVTLIFYFIAMGTMVGWGFISKQQKEADSENQINNSQPSKSEPGQSPSSSETTSSTSGNTYSLSGVSKHITPRDCWIAIDGNVYDVTKYLDMHPGGADLILIFCGQDATTAYNTKGGRRSGHSAGANRILAGYEIGTLK
jgi:cytochrome b involved in lipid metabolism